jgi:hypothetical protein
MRRRNIVRINSEHNSAIEMRDSSFIWMSHTIFLAECGGRYEYFRPTFVWKTGRKRFVAQATKAYPRWGWDEETKNP